MNTPYLLQGADTGLGWCYAYACWADAADAHIALADLDAAMGGMMAGIAGLLTDGNDE